MAVVKAQRAFLAVHADEAPALLTALQEKGLFEPIPPEAWPVEEAELEGARAYGDRPFDLEREAEALRRALSFLDAHAPETGGLKNLFSPKPAFSIQGLADGFRKFPLAEVSGKVRAAEADLQRIAVEETGIAHHREGLAEWRDVDVRMDRVRGLRETDVILAAGPPGSRESLMRALGDASARVHTEEISFGKEGVRFIAISLNEDGAVPEAALRGAGLTVIEKPDLLSESPGGDGEALSDDEKIDWGASPSEILARLDQRRSVLEISRRELLAGVRELAGYRAGLQAASDYVDILKARKDAEGWLVETGDVALAMGWVLEDRKEALRKGLAEEIAEVHVAFLDNRPEDAPPIQLASTAATRPFTVLTHLYGLPKHIEADPTPLLMPFFFVFFGLCLTDSGYGLVMALLFGWGLRKMVLGPSARNFFRLLMWGGISAFVFGAFVGGWFGNTLKILPASLGFLDRWANAVLVLDPIQNPVPFLMLSLILGVIQIYVGLVSKLVATWRKAGWGEALAGEGVEVFLLSGFLFLGLVKAGVLHESLGPAATWTAAAAAGTTVLARGRGYKNIFAKLGGGLLGIYALVNYLGDILSYSRLFALGLATGVIAVVVNTFTEILGQVPVAGAVLIPLVFVVGHSFNLVISALGAFIHSARLQYVEFFSKFYEGGGRAFAPFRAAPRYVDLETWFTP
jgi:V/A-type H+-transporting ATPase subunit I